MLKAIGIFLIIFGSVGLIQNLRFLMAFRKINKMAPDDLQGKTAINEHFYGLLCFSAGVFGLGFFLVIG